RQLVVRIRILGPASCRGFDRAGLPLRVIRPVVQHDRPERLPTALSHEFLECIARPVRRAARSKIPRCGVCAVPLEDLVNPGAVLVDPGASAAKLAGGFIAGACVWSSKS